LTTMHGVPFIKTELVRIGMIGLGARGLSLLSELLACDGAVTTAIADHSPRAVYDAQEMLRQAAAPPVRSFSGPESWKTLLELDLDMVIIATPWETHTTLSVAAMQAGKHVAVEVPAATTIDECWRLVETSESTRRHCVMLENCCYDYWESLVKRLVRAGKFGTLTHAECAYNHDLRSLLLADVSEGLWRRQAFINRDGNLYPTHGLGPVAQCLDIGDTDSFDYLVSMSSRSSALKEYRDQFSPEDDPKRDEVYICGDMNVSLIKTKQNRTIVLQHDSVTPRPYDRIFLIAGTGGIFRDYPPRLYLDGVGQAEEWLPLEEIRKEWEDPLWTNLGELARKRGGHGGMDFLMIYRLLQTFLQGLPPDSDVYDAADWSAPGPLSELSVKQRSSPVDFPDFRRYQPAIRR
jgi:predicted dehydrogenase